MNTTFAIVLPVRIDNADRLDNLKTVLYWVDKIGCPIILLEADRTPQVDTIISLYEHVRYCFVEDKNKVFHRTKYINVLLRMADVDVVAVWDADVILPYSQVNEAVVCVNTQSATIVYPHNGTFHTLSPKQSLEFRKNQDLLRFQNEKLTSMMGRTACGGVYLVNRKSTFLLVGIMKSLLDGDRKMPKDCIGFRLQVIMCDGFHPGHCTTCIMKGMIGMM